MIRIVLPLLSALVRCEYADSYPAPDPSWFSAPIGDRPTYDRPRPRPARRSDVPHGAIEPIAPSRIVDYGPEGHPYEQARRLREEGEGRRRRKGAGPEGENNLNDDRDAEVSRMLRDDDRYQPLRIHFDTTDLDRWSVQSAGTAQRIEYLKSHVLTGMARIWSSALSVIPVAGNLRIDHGKCPFADPAASPSFQPRGVGNADLVIYVTANSDFCSESGNNVLASAFSCSWDQFERPIAGSMDFCLDAIALEDGRPIVPGMNYQDGELLPSGSPESFGPGADVALRLAVGTAVHEIAHVLGITSSDMLFYYDYETGLPRTPDPRKEEVTCISGERRRMLVPDETTLRERHSRRGVRYFEVTLPTVRQVARNQFDCQRLTGAPLENQPTNEDCFGSHFEERFFFTESMSAVLGGVPELLSSLTLGLLHDSGWYRPDYSVATVSPFGHGAGCEFVEEPCVVAGQVPSYGSGAFCKTEYKVDNNEKFLGSFGCDPTHTAMGICDLVDYSNLSNLHVPPQEEFRYFPGMPTLGALHDRTDYCPTYSISTVTCQEVPQRLEMSLIPQLEYFATASESSGANSLCFDTDKARPICLESACDEDSYTVKVKVAGRVLTCDAAGQTHLIPGTSVSFSCPDIKSICPNLACPANCAGHGICDFSGDVPLCNCFDEADSTAGCFNSFRNTPPKKGWNDNIEGEASSSFRLRTSKHLLGLLHLMLMI